MLGLLAAVFVWSCSEDNLSSTSVIVDSVNKLSEFDLWLEQNYRAQFQIGFKYKYEDIESNMVYEVVPCEEVHSKIMAKMIKFLWLDAYTEAANLSFMRSFAPRVIMTIGSGSYNTNNTLLLGTAEGGVKITLYVGNWMQDMMKISLTNGVDDSDGFTITDINMGLVNRYYLHTIHHEFAHILDQTKSRIKEFDLISAGDYTANWNNTSTSAAAKLGFVSSYASSEAGEDWVEVLAYYITLSDADWNAVLSLAGETGAAKINQKLDYVKSYMWSTWNIDLDLLKKILARRYSEIDTLDWDNFKTE